MNKNKFKILLGIYGIGVAGCIQRNHNMTGDNVNTQQNVAASRSSSDIDSTSDNSLRNETVNKLITEIKTKFDISSSLEKLKNFLVHMDPNSNTLNFEGYEPLIIYTFQTPENQNEINNTVKNILYKQKEFIGCCIPEKSKGAKNLFWCIASSDAPKRNIGDLDDLIDEEDLIRLDTIEDEEEIDSEEYIHYYVNLFDADLLVYKRDTKGTLQLVRQGNQNITIDNFKEISIKDVLGIS